METVVFILLIILTVIFFILEISLKSFSRISLAGFIEDLPMKKRGRIDVVKKYDTVINSLGAFSFFFQLLLFIYSFFIIRKTFSENPLTIFLLIFLFITLFDLILYTIAFFFKEKILEKLLPFLIFPWIFFYPANYIFSILLKKKKLTDNIDSAQDDLSEKELEVFIEEGRREGVIEKEDREMIESVLEFGDTLVKEIMTPRVDMQYVEEDIKINDLIKIIENSKKSRYPVISGRIDNITGVILSKDIFNYWNNKGFKLKNIIREPFFIPETMRILELLKELQRSKQKFAIVVDEFGGVSGVITMEDLIEEIVGEIKDEYDEDIEQIVKEKDFYIVKGDTDIIELSEALDLDIKGEEDYQTVSGLINYKLGKIPERNESININNYIFEVIDIKNNRIRKVKIYYAKNS